MQRVQVIRLVVVVVVVKVQPMYLSVVLQLLGTLQYFEGSELRPVLQPGYASPSDYGPALGPAAGDKVVQVGPEMESGDAVPAGVPVVASVVPVVASVGPGALPPSPSPFHQNLVFQSFAQES